MRIESSIELDFSQVLFRPQRTAEACLDSRKDAVITRTFKFKHSPMEYDGVPIIAANMDSVGTMEMAKSLRDYQIMTALHKHFSIEELVNFFKSPDSDTSFYSLGIVDADFDKFKQVFDKVGLWNGKTGIKQVCIDVANGYTQAFIDYVKKFRDTYPSLTIMAGNVVTREITEQLIFSGVDIVKVGIGPGSVCTTRKMTGVGRPQLSAVIECAEAAHGIKGHVCSDGGCTNPGDVSKAFGGGADFVMLGGMLAGHAQGGGDLVVIDDQEYYKFYGMSSKEAMTKYSGGVANYRASEGKCVLIKKKESLDHTLQDILGGVRSTCLYVGAKYLKDLSKRTSFYVVQNQINNVFGTST